MCKDGIDYSIPSEMLTAVLPPLITVKQAEAIGAGSGRKIRLMCARGELKAAKVGTDWRLARDPFLRHFGLLD